MDPRHPELAIQRLRELMSQYNRIEEDMSKAVTTAQLGQLEREGGLVVQEMCLVAPRIHEAMMQSSRQRRAALAHGQIESGFYTGEAAPEQVKATEETEKKEEDVSEKPKKKTAKKSYKKKSTKKVEKAEGAE